jgi:hypothetical protein
MSLGLAYGFGCGISKPRNPLGKQAMYIDSLSKGVLTDSGTTITGLNGSVSANGSDASSDLSAFSTPADCYPTAVCKSCS